MLLNQFLELKGTLEVTLLDLPCSAGFHSKIAVPLALLLDDMEVSTVSSPSQFWQTADVRNFHQEVKSIFRNFHSPVPIMSSEIKTKSPFT